VLGPHRVRKGTTLAPLSAAGLVFLAALAYRAYLSRWVTFPAPVDACYYYDVAANLAAGHGLTIGYVWNYLNGVPNSLPVPSNEYWQPLVSIILAGFFKVTGASWQAAKFCGALFGSFMAVLCLWYGLRIGLGLAAAVCAALLLAAQPSMAFASTSDTSVYSGVVVAAALLCALKGAERGGHWWSAAGALAGMAYLVRSDGVLALVGVAAVWFFQRRRAARPWWELAACVGSFAVVVAPWLVRNLVVFGKPMPVGIAKAVLLRRYPEVFASRPEVFSLSAFVKSGLLYQAASRLLTLGKNAEDLLRLISFVVLPFALYELVRGRREITHWAVLFYFLLALLFTALVIPFAARKGTFEHMLPAMEVFFWPLGMLGIVHLWRMVPALKRINPLVGVGIATALVAAHYSYWTVSSIPELVKMCREREQLQVLADRWLDQRPGSERLVFTDDPWSFYYRTRRPCAMIPADDYPTIIKVAKHLRCRYVLWRPKEQLVDWPKGAAEDKYVVFRTSILERLNVFELFYPESQDGQVSPDELLRAHLAAGIALGRSGLMDQAPYEFTKAVACGPNSFEAHLYLGAALRRLGVFDQAKPALARALQLQPKNQIALAEMMLAERDSQAASSIPLPPPGPD